MKKKVILVILAAALSIASLTGCGSGGSAALENAGQGSDGNGEQASAEGDIGGQSLEVAITYTGPQAEVFKGITAGFEEEYGCKVSVVEYGDDYETTMKTRMASNELPDIWQTHGWSILRYKEYLMDLRNEPWVADYDESALGVIEDKDGSIYVLMLNELVNCTLVDLDVCKEAGVDPYTIHTWDDFAKACQKIKDAGYTPIGSAMGPGLIATISGTWLNYEGETHNESEAMLDGTYDWSSYKVQLDDMASWIEAGYFYNDILTMNGTDMNERFASGKAAFCLSNDPTFLLGCLEVNPDKNYALLPTFASEEAGVEHVGIGEGDTFGIWSDTKNEAAAKAFLEYLARPEVAKTLNEVSGKVSCLKSAMEGDESYGLTLFMDMQEKCKGRKIHYENLWDRQYMPSGMWPIYGNACNMLFDNYSEEGIQEVIDYLHENYVDLFAVAQEQS